MDGSSLQAWVPLYPSCWSILQIATPRKGVRYNVISGPHRICGEWNSPYPLEIVGREWIRRTPDVVN